MWLIFFVSILLDNKIPTGIQSGTNQKLLLPVQETGNSSRKDYKIQGSDKFKRDKRNKKQGKKKKVSFKPVKKVAE